MTEQFFNYVCSLTLIPRDFGLELMRCFLAKTKENAKTSSNIRFSHSCKSWREIFECFPKILLRENETIKVVRRLRLFVIIRQCCMYTIPLVCFVIFHWIYALLLNLFQKRFCFVKYKKTRKLAKFQKSKLSANLQYEQRHDTWREKDSYIDSQNISS